MLLSEAMKSSMSKFCSSNQAVYSSLGPFQPFEWVPIRYLNPSLQREGARRVCRKWVILRLCYTDVLRTMPSKAIELASFDMYKRLLARDSQGAGMAGLATSVAGGLAGAMKFLTPVLSALS